MTNHQLFFKIYVESKSLRREIRNNLMRLHACYAGLVENADNYLWKIQARDDKGSCATITLYTSGNLVVLGHGNIFDLTKHLLISYNTSMRNNSLASEVKTTSSPDSKLNPKKKFGRKSKHA